MGKEGSAGGGSGVIGGSGGGTLAKGYTFEGIYVDARKSLDLKAGQKKTDWGDHAPTSLQEKCNRHGVWSACRLQVAGQLVAGTKQMDSGLSVVAVFRSLQAPAAGACRRKPQLALARLGDN